MLENITRPNVDGVAYRKTGKRGHMSEALSRIGVTNAAAAKALVITYRALKSTLITVTEENLEVHTNVMVGDVEAVYFIVDTAVGLAEVATTFIVQANWSFETTEV